jgi:hypothetical protein
LAGQHLRVIHVLSGPMSFSVSRTRGLGMRCEGMWLVARRLGWESNLRRRRLSMGQRFPQCLFSGTPRSLGLATATTSAAQQARARPQPGGRFVERGCARHDSQIFAGSRIARRWFAGDGVMRKSFALGYAKAHRSRALLLKPVVERGPAMTAVSRMMESRVPAGTMAG